MKCSTTVSVFFITCHQIFSVSLIFLTTFSVPSPGGGSPVRSTVTPARPLLRATPASLFRQAGMT